MVKANYKKEMVLIKTKSQGKFILNVKIKTLNL